MARKPKKGSGDSVVATMPMREHVERARSQGSFSSRKLLPRLLRTSNLPPIPPVLKVKRPFTGGTGGKTKGISFRLRTRAYEAKLSDTVIVP